MTYASGAWVACDVSAFGARLMGVYKRHRSNEAPTTGSSASKTQGKGINMNVARTLNNWRKYRQTVAELGRMTPRELNDLGIDRSDIRRVARTAVGF
jgi:uncharacterized protein YjiS (DUF1127 family)